MTDREMTAEESDAEMSASRERNIETARSTNFEAYLAVKARAELAEARADRLQDALRGARDALGSFVTTLNRRGKMISCNHDELCAALDGAEASSAAIDALLSGVDK